MATTRKTYDPVVEGHVASTQLSACALVGVNSVNLGWSLPDTADRRQLLGFGLRRSDFDKNDQMIRSEWFYGNKRFPHQLNQDFGASISSYIAPFQRFNWNDYTLDPDRSYKYEIFPFYGNPENPTRLEPTELWVKPSKNEVKNWGVYTNRGVTATHAYLEQFKSLDPQAPDNIKGRVWLSRGLKESLIRFIDAAINGDALSVTIYEFEDADVAHALKSAKERGVKVHIVYHAKADDKQTPENEHALSEAGLLNDANATARQNVPNISHNKFVVLEKQGKPIAVWTGTCNFTFAGFYLQTNMALEVKNEAVAKAYLQYHQILKNAERHPDPQNPVKKQVESLISALDATFEKMKIKFSPVNSDHLLDISSDLISKAKSAIFISAPFALDKSMMDALSANNGKVLEYGLCNVTAKTKIEGMNSRNTRFFVPSRLESYAGKKWDAKAFGSHKIHSKTLVIDPWSDNPKVVIGTANFSDESCRKNDENFMVIEGDKRLAAIVTTEFIRMWEHYKNRAFINDSMKQTALFAAENLLDEDGSWSKTAYDPNSPSYKYRERLVFSGQE